jgi:hypothetical protein
MLIELALSGKFIYDIVKRLKNDKVFRTLGFLLFCAYSCRYHVFLAGRRKIISRSIAYAVGTLSMNSPYNLAPQSTIGVIFNLIYIFIGVGVYLIFILEAGKNDYYRSRRFRKEKSRKESSQKSC